MFLWYFFMCFWNGQSKSSRLVGVPFTRASEKLQKAERPRWIRAAKKKTAENLKSSGELLLRPLYLPYLIVFFFFFFFKWFSWCFFKETFSNPSKTHPAKLLAPDRWLLWVSAATAGTATRPPCSSSKTWQRLGVIKETPPEASKDLRRYSSWGVFWGLGVASQKVKLEGLQEQRSGRLLTLVLRETSRESHTQNQH